MISWDRVNELRGEVGEEDFAEVVEIFLEEVDEVIDRLRKSPNPASYADDLHFLKGSALNLGFDQFGQTCHDCESRLPSADNHQRDIGLVISSYESSRAEFLSQFQGKPKTSQPDPP